MILDIENASASWSNGKIDIAFDVTPSDDYRLELKTGEIFQNKRYAALRQEESEHISGTLFITGKASDAAGNELSSSMRYVPGGGRGGPELHWIWHLPDDQLKSFHSLIEAGKLPRTATIFPEYDGLDVGRMGDGWVWDNENKHTILINDVWFRFKLSQLAEESTNLELLRKLSTIENSLARISWLVGLLALGMLGIVLLRF